MAGWHHWLDGCASEWTLGVGDGQGGLVCCNSWGHKESDTTERLNWTELNQSAKFGRIQSIKNNDSNITCWVWKIIQSDTHFLNEGGSKKASSSLQKNASYTCRSNRISILQDLVRAESWEREEPWVCTPAGHLRSLCGLGQGKWPFQVGLGFFLPPTKRLGLNHTPLFWWERTSKFHTRGHIYSRLAEISSQSECLPA